MTKIFTSGQMKIVDRETAQEQCISDFQLMERTASVLLSALSRRFVLSKQRFVIFCGKGNNGGDGLVLAQYLRQHQAKVILYLLEAESYAKDNLEAQKRNPASLINRFSLDEQLDIPADAVVVDCLFGYGLHRTLDDSWTNIVGQINRAGCQVIAVDMPSGLLSDMPTPKRASVVYANEVLTFQSPKLALLMPDNQSFFERFDVLDIGLSPDAIYRMESDYVFVTEEVVKSYYRRRKRFDHKGVFGHSLIIGGSYGKMGAVQLALKAALRSGCGLLSACIPCCGYTIVQTAVPEAMVITDNNNEDVISFFPDMLRYQAVGIGIGMGTDRRTVDAFRTFLSLSPDVPLVLDADALNILARQPEWLASVPSGSILTPHPKELKRIIGDWENDWDKIEKVKRLADRYSLCILIKGANSATILPGGKVFFNSTGNVGLATGGTGDVLTGMVTALRGQGYPSDQALILGVYLHGRAADIAVKEIGTYSLSPSDIVRFLPKAFLELEK